MPPLTTFTATEPVTQRKLRGVVKRFYAKQRKLEWIYGALTDITDTADALYPLTRPRWLNVRHFGIEVEREVRWRDGPRVLLPARTDVPDFSGTPVPLARTGTELFCGSGHLALAYEREGFRMQRYDRKLDGAPGRCNTDWDVITSAELASLLAVSVVHVSPDCSTYSQLAGSRHGRKRANDFLGVSEKARRANGHAVKLFDALRARVLAPDSPLIFTAENPEATFQLHPMVERLCRPVDEGGCGGGVIRLSFCAFGERVRKNTVFVTNSPTLRALAGDDRFYCKRGNKRCPFHKRMPHEPVTVRNKFDHRGKRVTTHGKSTDEVTAFPHLLSEFIAKCVDVDVARLMSEDSPCEHARCRFNRGHRGACSHMMVVAK